MKRIVPVVVILLIIQACQRESITDQQTLIQDFSSTEETLQFLAQHHPEVYNSAEMERLNTMLAEPVQTRGNGATVEVEAPSENALQAAIEEAGEGGTVVLKAGEHKITNMVTIGHETHLTGETNAVLEITNTPLVSETDIIIPGLYIHGGDKTSITRLNIKAGGGLGGTAILVRNSSNVVIEKCKLENFQFSIINEYGDKLKVTRNEVNSSSEWQTGALPIALGITNINGKNVIINNNKVFNSFFGIWCCDENGVSMGNETFGCYLGQILCKVPPAYPLFDGTIMGSDQSANRWLQMNNYSHNNIFVGYLAIDGAHDNFIVGNKTAENGMYDMELTGDTERFGFLTPKAYNNTVYVTPDFIVKDCGENNKVVGGKKVDTSVDACF